MSKDDEQLRLLAIFHYVLGGIIALFACFALIYVAMGIFFVVAPEEVAGGEGGAPPAAFGWLFATIGGVIFLLGEALGLGVVLAGRAISKRKCYTFAFVVACIECAFMPFGTVLGIFTIMALQRDSVRAQFGRGVAV